MSDQAYSYSLYQDHSERRIFNSSPELPSHCPSPPLPTQSSQDALQAPNISQDRCAQEKFHEPDDFDYDDDEIQRDAANEWAALIVHLALGFFLLLFFCCIVFSILVVSQYGFVAFMALTSLVLIVLGLAYFVAITIAEDSIMRPARKKLRRFHAIATAVAINELRNIQLDIYDHLMLENEVGNSNDEDVNEISPNQSNSSVQNEKDGKSRRKRRRIPRSALFGVIVAPFLKKKKAKKFKFDKKKRGKDASDEALRGDDHSIVSLISIKLGM